MKTRNSIRRRAGATLVEVMVASVVLAILALGVAASMALARGKTNVQRDHRSALELANARMEELRAAGYNEVKPTSLNYTTYYLAKTTSVWTISAGDPNERVLLNNQLRPLRTTVQYVDIDGGSASYDCLKLTVRVQFNSDANQLVTLETFKSP